MVTRNRATYHVRFKGLGGTTKTAVVRGFSAKHARQVVKDNHPGARIIDVRRKGN